MRKTISEETAAILAGRKDSRKSLGIDLNVVTARFKEKFHEQNAQARHADTKIGSIQSPNQVEKWIESFKLKDSAPRK